MYCDDRPSGSYQQPSRRLRIRGNPDHAVGYQMTIVDADTGEQLRHVACAVIYLNPTRMNEVELTHYVEDEHGRFILKGEGQQAKPVTWKERCQDPDVDLLAYDRPDKTEYILRKREGRP